MKECYNDIRKYWWYWKIDEVALPRASKDFVWDRCFQASEHLAILDFSRLLG